MLHIDMEKIRALSSVQVNLPQAVSDEIFAWGESNIPDEEMFIDVSNMHFGREDEIHVTILYGLHADSPLQTRELVARSKPFEITLGKVGVFTNKDKFDVVKIDVISQDLIDLNSRFIKNVVYTNKYSVYQPHVTIAYVCKGKGWKYGGVDVFDGTKVLIDHVMFSSRTGMKTNIKLNG